MVSCLKSRAVLLLGLLAWLALPARGYAANKYFYVMGGGGEPDGAGTIFDSELKTFGDFASHSDWQTTLSFDGGHSQTEKIAAGSFPRADDLGPFTSQHFQDMLQDIGAKLNSGKIAPGDELMLMIDSHGAMNYSRQLTHDIATAKGSATDLTTLAGAQTVSLDALRDVIHLANQKGVKLAIIDESCFSGNTQALANDKTCVISITGTHQFGYASQGPAGLFSTDTFAGKFDRSLKNGRNLEDLFVNARTADDSPDFPMISTPVGEQLRDELYRVVSPYLAVDNEYDLFSSQYSTATIDADSCETARNFSDLTHVLDNLSSAAQQSGEDLEMDGLKRALQKYRDYQIHYEQAVKGTQVAGNEFKTLLATDYPDQKGLFASEDGVASLFADYGPSISFYQRLYDQADTDYAKNLWKETLDQLQLKQKIVADLRTKLSPAAQKSLQNYNEALTDASRRTPVLASAVSGQLKKVYDVLYRARSKAAGSSNACRDFVL